MRRGRNPPGCRGGFRRLSGLERADSFAARRVPAGLGTGHQGQSGGSGQNPDSGRRQTPGRGHPFAGWPFGQAPGRGQGRDSAGRVLFPLVRRGMPPCLRRRHPVVPSGHPGSYPACARGRGRGHHPLEFPLLHVAAQGRSGSGRRLHHRGQARGPHALQRSGPGRAGHARGHSRRGHQCADRRRGGHRRRNRGQSHGAQGQLHRLHGGGQATGRRLRAHAQAHVPGTGRQRALYGL